MKYLYILALVLIVSSCSGSKKVIENASNKTAKVEPVVVEIDTETDNKNEVSNENEQDNTNENETTKAETELVSEEELPQPEHETTLIYSDHSIYDALLQKYVSSTGEVDYIGIKKDSKVLREYLNVLSEKLPEDYWVKEEKLAYWINAYNAMTIDLIIRNYPIKSIKDIDKPWEQRLWKLGKKWYNLDEIEHQIIRKMGEPRIHFALVCAAQSCPKLYNRAFTPDELNDDLTRLTEEFLADTSKNNITEGQLKLSKIFKWFAKDFKQQGTLIDFLNEYTVVNISTNAKKSFKDYNWELND